MSTFNPTQVLRHHPAERLYPSSNALELESPTPISSSAEWRLAQRYWQSNGETPFADGSVPYVVNNSGWSPRAAAELVLAAGRGCPGPVVIIEVAAGCGVFARQALDHLQQRCDQGEGDVYSRLTWVCTDAAQESVDSWQQRGQFDAHAQRVVLAQADAQQLADLELPTGTVLGVIANYALDSLPLEVVRDDGCLLHLQSVVYADEPQLEQLVGLSLAEIRQRLTSADPSELDVLLPLLQWLELSACFLPGKVEHAAAALAAAQAPIAAVNIGALRFLGGALSQLSQGAFVLINDYGPTTQHDLSKESFLHRFGGTATGSLNFPHLEHWLQQHGCVVKRPQNDSTRTIHTRLAIVGENVELEKTFEQWFSDPRYVAADRIGAWTSVFVSGGRVSEALEIFEQHLQWCPTDWHQLAEAAQLLLQQFGQAEQALELVDEARRLNPWTSTLIWNITGAVRFSLGDLAGAEEAWHQAYRINPAEPSTWINFAFLHAERGDLQQALGAIASGLACDHGGQYRSTLLQKQAELLSLQSQRHAAKTDRQNRRHRRLVDALRPTFV